MYFYLQTCFGQQLMTSDQLRLYCFFPIAM